MSELAKEKLYRKELQKVGAEGKNNVERIRSLGNVIRTFDVEDIVNIPTELCEALKCGDVVNKVDVTGKHAYRVSYKKDDEGMCLTYVDATTVETVAYDLIEGTWTYNSTDKTTLTPDA